MENEVWKPINKAEGYEISNFGRVRKTYYYKLSWEVNGYLTVPVDGKTRLVHQLVANTFVPGKKSGLQVNHIDGNKRNNHFSNLEWVTPKDNMLHAARVTGAIPRGSKSYNLQN